MQRLILIATACLVASCTPIIDQRGHAQDQLDTSQIVPGQTRSDDVQALLGTPSATSTFGEKTWYYISEKKETRGMMAPKVIGQNVTAVKFNDDDTVADVSASDKSTAKDVEYVEKETPTEGRHLTMWEQLMGNFGKFAAPGRQIDPRNLGH